VSSGALERRRPAYSLDRVQLAFAKGQFQVTVRAMRHLDRRGWSKSAIVACVALLKPADFYKSQRHLERPDAWLDIYKPVSCGERLYVKFTLLEDGETYLVLSFCGDGEKH
jgi:hypothetical protein